MKQYRHKSTGRIATENAPSIYKRTYKYKMYDSSLVESNVPADIIEDSNDWEEIKEDTLSVCEDTDGDNICPKCIKQPKSCPKREEKKPEYTILSFTDSYNNYKRYSEGFSINLQYFYPESTLLANQTVKIYSVRRESDGEVFTLGDKIKHDYEKEVGWEITLFHFRDNDLARINVKCKGYVDSTFCGVKDIVKIKEVKLFTTEDGVDIYKGDEFYYLAASRPLDTYPINKIGYMTAALGSTAASAHKRFSTKEKAEEYVLMNRLLFNVHDMLSVRAKGLREKDIIELAKSKLK